jgi:branched-chain amino acid transport system substrate-binding protein
MFRTQGYLGIEGYAVMNPQKIKMWPHTGCTLLSTAILLISALLFSATLAAANAPEPKDAPLEVGLILSLSGQLAAFGHGIQQGVELARAEGRAPLLSFTYDDDQSVSQRGVVVSALQSILQKKIKIVTMSGMPNVAIADQIVSARGAIALSILDSNEGIKKLSENIFGFGWSNEGTARRSAALAINNLKAKSVAIVAGNDEWSEIMGHAFAEEIKRNGGVVAHDSSVDLAATDFRSLATKIVKLKPDVVYFPLYGPALLSFARQLKQVGYSGTMMSAEGVTDVEIQALGAAAEGMWVTGAYLSNSDFEQRYKKHFKQDAITVNTAHVALGYDLALFLNAAAQKMQMEQRPFDDANLRAVIGAISVNGIMGTTSFTNRVITGRVQHLFVVRDGKLVPQ